MVVGNEIFFKPNMPVIVDPEDVECFMKQLPPLTEHGKIHEIMLIIKFPHLVILWVLILMCGFYA